MDAETNNADQSGPTQRSVGFSLPAAREVLSVLSSVQLGSEDSRRKAIVSSLTEYERQLNSIESLYRVQTTLALEFGLHGALAEGCADAVGNMAELSADPHAIAAALPDVFSVTDGFMDREHVRALSYQAGCPQEAVRKELRAFQKTSSDRLRLAAKRAKAMGQDPLPPPAAGVRSMPTFRSTSPHVAGGIAQPRNGPQPPPQHQQHPAPALIPTMDERLYCWDETEEAARKAQLAKLSGLLNPDTGGICKDPISTVGVFQQQMAVCQDWRVRRVALEAMSRSSLEVLWRLLQNSRVLDSLHSWLQEALADHQVTMLKLLLSTLACLPMRRDMLKGSRLEAALESLAAGERRGGAAASATDDGGNNVDMRRRFGAAAAGVLAEWRKDPDHATILRRAGAVVVSEAPAAAAMRTASSAQAGAGASAAAGAAAPHIPGSRLLGNAAAKDGMRKRALSMPRPPSDARLAMRPRALETAGGGSGASASGNALGGGSVGGTSGNGGFANGRMSSSLVNGGQASGGAISALKHAAPLVGSAVPPARPSSSVKATAKAAVDMTAKLGEKGPADPDVVAGFRSRFGDGSVRRSQLARPPRATTTAPPTARESSPGPALATSAAAGGAGGAVQPVAAFISEVGADELARLRAERAAKRQATALMALQAEARRHPEVAAAEAEFQERLLRAKREAVLRAEAAKRVSSDEVRRRLEALREAVPWSGPPPELLLQPDDTPTGTGEESAERLERAQERERMAKVAYPSRDRIPDSPAEPPGQALLSLQHPQQPPPRPFPWVPFVEAEEGAMDWFRQNIVLWEKGMRRAEYVLPPALLHKHLELAPELLPPQFAPPPPPPPAPSVASGQPASFGPAAHQHPSQLQPQPQRHHSQHAPPPPPRSGSAMRHRAPHSATTDAPPPAAGAAPPPAAASAAAAGLVDTDWQQQHHRPHLAPPQQQQQQTVWERPGERQQQQAQPSLLSEPAPIVVLNVMPGKAAPTVLVPLMTMPPAPALQAQTQPHMSYSQGQAQHPGGGGQLWSQQPQPYEYGHGNGRSAPEERSQYGHHAGNGDLPPPPPHAKHGQPPPQYNHHHQKQQAQQHHPPPAYQQAEPAQNQHHHVPDSHAPYGQRHSSFQNGHSTQHGSPARGDGGPGGYGSAAYGGHYAQQEQQQRPEYHGGWRDSRGYQQPWDNGSRG